MKYEQGKLLEWRNGENKQIVWMVADNGTHGMVLHSDGLISIGTITNLEPLKDELKPFVGSVTINSTTN